MSWRNNARETGANTIPLGNRRRFGDDQREDSFASTPDAGHNGDGHANSKRGRSPERKPVELNPDGTKKRRKRNRWGDAADNKAAGLMNLPTAIEAHMTPEQLEAYVVHIRIEEISQKLRINDVVPADGDRSPSPPPQYDNFGRRTNTREYRYRKKLEDERHKLIEKAMRIIPAYHPPSDYRRPTKTQEKIYVPVNDYPEINFIGLLIGPRGNTLKKMETQSGAKIAIRGKGSVKEGKGKSDAAHASNQDEDLHCLIMADTEEKVNKAKELIHQVIETNELKRNQLRELAALNGTLRDDENQACQNCGEIGHRKFDCPHNKNFTASIICRQCGNAGHMARDCPDRQRGSDWRNLPPRRGPVNAIDNDYENLMKEIGGGGAATADTTHASRQIGWDNGHDANDSGGRAPAPWERGATGAPAPWQQRPPPAGGSAAPWQNRSQDNYDHGYSNQQAPAAPWLSNRGGGGGGGSGGGPPAPWQTGGHQAYGIPPPPPPSGDIPPPPPPSDIPPPPPPPPA